MLEEAIRTGLRHAGYDGALEKLAVEFESAGASSLNIAILANFDGAVQAEYQELERLLQRLCVDACNEHGWIIPFSQLTVHMAGEGGSSLP